jgi:heme/copper-type cytochrome/quinol oxidase subunit 3
MIGWLAGANCFEVPFINVTAANMQYLRIGLWETTAYSLVCGVTLTKSLLISETFPPKKWSQTRKLKDIKLSITEIIILLISSIMLIVAAIIETYSIIG